MLNRRTSKGHAWVIIVFAAVVVAAASYFTVQQRRSTESVNCSNYMLSICIAARMWANDNDDRMPPDLLALSNELITPKVLHCPADRSRPRVRTWADFNDAVSSYEVVAPSARDSEINTVFLRCRVHEHLGYADGTVFDGQRRRTNRLDWVR